MDVIIQLLEKNGIRDEPQTKNGIIDDSQTLHENDHKIAIEAIEKFETNELTSKSKKIQILSNIDYQIRTGNAYFSIGNYEESIKRYDRVLILNPEHVTALNNKALALFELKKFKESIPIYDQLIPKLII